MPRFKAQRERSGGVARRNSNGAAIHSPKDELEGPAVDPVPEVRPAVVAPTRPPEAARADIRRQAGAQQIDPGATAVAARVRHPLAVRHTPGVSKAALSAVTFIECALVSGVSIYLLNHGPKDSFIPSGMDPVETSKGVGGTALAFGLMTGVGAGLLAGWTHRARMQAQPDVRPRDVGYRPSESRINFSVAFTAVGGALIGVSVLLQGQVNRDPVDSNALQTFGVFPLLAVGALLTTFGTGLLAYGIHWTAVNRPQHAAAPPLGAGPHDVELGRSAGAVNPA